jgi:peptidoglycan hydrolase-like protein with peptidoglycan-binding domain
MAEDRQRVLILGEKQIMKKLVVRAAILAMFTAGMATTVGIAGAGTALACGWNSNRSDALAASLPQVNYGDHGAHVLSLQLALRAQGYKNLQGTGNYATNTLTAVRDFQRKHGIKDSGIVGSKTWHALVGPLSQNVTRGSVGGPPTFGITPGERNSEKVMRLAATITRIDPYGDRDWDEGGVYGPKLQQLVRDFQHRAGIKASGIVGPKTWAALDETVAVAGRWGC